MCEWISCKEKLPPGMTVVLVKKWILTHRLKSGVNYWYYPSGMIEDIIYPTHKWKPVECNCRPIKQCPACGKLNCKEWISVNR